MKALVTIIVPVYNVEYYLEACLKSVLQQTFRNFEIIVVNDGSTDGSLELLEALSNRDNRIKIISQTNQGLSGARNTGLRHAKGDYVVFVDSDDYVNKSLLERVVSTFEAYKSDLVVFNHADFTDGNSYIIPREKKLAAGPWETTLFLEQARQLATSTWNPVWLYAYKKAFLDRYNLRFHLGIFHEDILFTPIALTKANSIAYIPTVLYYYRKRSGSITTDPLKAEKSLRDYAFVAEQLFHFSMSIVDQNKKEAFLDLLAKRFQFVVEESQRQNQEFSIDIYEQVVKSIRSKKVIYRRLSKRFYEQHIETSWQRRKQIVMENLIKWPRRIYKYQIKPRLK